MTCYKSSGTDSKLSVFLSGDTVLFDCVLRLLRQKEKTARLSCRLWLTASQFGDPTSHALRTKARLPTMLAKLDNSMMLSEINFIYIWNGKSWADDHLGFLKTMTINKRDSPDVE